MHVAQPGGSISHTGDDSPAGASSSWREVLRYLFFLSLAATRLANQPASAARIRKEWAASSPPRLGNASAVARHQLREGGRR